MLVRIGVGLVCSLGLIFLGSAFGATRYVNATNASPASPYTSLASASTNIQQAIDVAVSGDEILVAPGIYRIRSTVAIPNHKRLTLRSTQSRAAIIDSQRLCRGMMISGTNSLVEGFTIQNGLTNGNYGGGLYINVPCTIRDCLITSNQAWAAGGMFIYAPSVLVDNCTIQSNLATYVGGGVDLYNYSTSVLNRCIIRGNVASNYAGGILFDGAGTVSNSWISNNRSILSHGGGVKMAQGGNLVNSVVVGNRAQTSGGGIYASFGTMVHCTVVSNTAMEGGGGVRAFNFTAWNSIVYYNPASSNENVYADGSTFSNCCTTTNLGGSNFMSAPTFVSRATQDYHLVVGSSCVDSGATNPAVNIDYDGNPRPVAGMTSGLARYDVGAFEFQVGWDSGYTDIGGGWRRLTWFGDYVPMGGEGWIWHNKHGFMFATPSSTSTDIWFYANDMGWLWTSSTTYPFLYRSSDGAWLWYNGATNPRWFRNMTANTWESRNP